MSSLKRRNLAKDVSTCALEVYQRVNSCAHFSVPHFGLPPFESNGKLGAMTDYLNPFSDRVIGKRKESKPCQNPDIVPMFEEAIAPFHNDTDGRWLAVEKIPQQYLRCILQVPEAKVKECVVSTVHKLQWLPDRLIVYGGQKSCSSRPQILAVTAVNMWLSIVQFVGIVWWTRIQRRTDPDCGRSFSWVGLFQEVITGIGNPIICGLIIRTQFPENSLAAGLGIYFLTPRTTPFIALISGLWFSKGYGTQMLLVELISAGAALVFYNLPLKVWHGPLSTVATDPSWPDTSFLYRGLYLATVPAGIIFFIYQSILILAVVLLGLSIWAKSKGLAKAAGYVAGIWLVMWIWIFSFALFAIMEIIWMAYYKKKGRKFTVLDNARAWFSREGSTVGFFLKTFGYWSWVLASFMITAGRWMFLTELLRLTGGAFCPDSLKSATAASIMLQFAAISAHAALKLRGLAL
ncbi:hypothetical protein EJ04DRAFT_568319 [Polyplosphaeria fusca]|uniref:Uncharacterized protein n=1 Tax=Polyplosphaeria fusca TaxID=682080 RepID=A0A9P4UY97_9PLEO|nr:hypothetical protein EJ04DRAFT_568319 [Polyplosphaeria fusca]